MAAGFVDKRAMVEVICIGTALALKWSLGLKPSNENTYQYKQ